MAACGKTVLTPRPGAVNKRKGSYDVPQAIEKGYHPMPVYIGLDLHRKEILGVSAVTNQLGCGWGIDAG